MDNLLLADLLVLLHLGFVGFIVLGFGAILVGRPLGWTWIRGRRWRMTHVGCMVFVTVETLAGFMCPLTVWEDRLRISAGATVAEGSFMGRLAHSLLFYSFPPWVFAAAYVALALLAVVLWRTIPPTPRRSKAPRAVGP